ncbi:MAG: hypothetical protein ABEK59_04485 [Halobacteria archaeon]
MNILFQTDNHILQMSEHDSRRISHDLVSEPHIEGRRISVRQIYALVEESDVEPETVADR